MEINDIEMAKIKITMKGRYSIYSPIYQEIRKMPIDSAKEIKLDKPDSKFGIKTHTNFRSMRTNFKICVYKQNREGTIWQIIKKEKRKKS